jgi:hypothetical protein
VKEEKMQNLKRISVVIFVLLALVACGQQKSIIVDTTGLTPEQAKAIEWKVQYAVALDWYEWELKSYKNNLDLLPKEDALVVHEKLWPLIKSVKLSITTLGALAYSQDPDADPAAAYEAYFQAKQALLQAIMMAFAEKEVQ